VSCAPFLLACAIAAAAETAHGQDFPDCPPSDSQCLDDNHVAACSIRAASVESCLAWIATLERHAKRGSVEASRHMGLAYQALADLSGVPSEASDYRERAIRIYRELIEREYDARAMISLAMMIGDEDEGIELLKKGLALAPDEYWSTQFLASKLMRRRRPGDAFEAARHMEWAYDQQPGPDRWSHLASLTYGYYEEAGSMDEAARFREKVLGDLGVVQLTKFPANAVPKDVSRVLMALCDAYLIPAIGISHCLTSLDTVIGHLSSAEHNSTSQEFADVVASAMVELVKGEPELSQSLQTRTENLLALGFDSSAVQRARETIPTFEGVIIVQ
jgi:tetratricopeptide (TPR) repeat protein